jgi:DNA-binding transcriptional ArsR family regulator
VKRDPQNPDPRDLRRAASIFKVLSHPHRLHLACLLSNGEPTTQRELIDELGLPQSTMARHLASLRDLGLIEATRSGQEVLLRMGSRLTGELMAAVCAWVHPEAGEQFRRDYAALARGRRR